MAQAGFFDVVIVTNGGDSCCSMDQCYPGAKAAVNAYLAQFPATAVATVDGNDLSACHTDFANQLSRVDVHFSREPSGKDWGKFDRPYSAKFQRPKYAPPL